MNVMAKLIAPVGALAHANGGMTPEPNWPLPDAHVYLSSNAAPSSCAVLVNVNSPPPPPDVDSEPLLTSEPPLLEVLPLVDEEPPDVALVDALDAPLDEL